MRLIVDTTNVQFQVTSNPKEKNDQTGKQKFNIDGLPMWTTQVLAQDGENGEVLQVSVAGAKPSVTVGQLVRPLGLEAIPWNNNGKHGVAFRATEIKPIAGSGK
jgi:hypothetical protein